MKRRLLSFLIFTLLIFTPFNAVMADDPEFVSGNGDHLELNDKSYHFNAANNDHLYYSSRFMIDDLLNDANGLGLKAFRTWASSEGQNSWKTDSFGRRYCFQPEPGVYDDDDDDFYPGDNDNTFRKMDYIIAKAKELGIRLILPLVNNWDDGFGGIPQYTRWSISAKSDLHMDIYNPGNPCQMTVALRTGSNWDWYEAPEMTLQNGWNNISVFLQSPVWMCQANGWTYSSPIANLDNVRQLGILVYTSNGVGVIYLDNVRLGPAGRPILWDNAESLNNEGIWRPEDGNDATGVSISSDYYIEGSYSLKLDFDQALPREKAIWKKDTAMGNHDIFFFDVDCKTLYKNYIEHFLNRVNSITGAAYKDDPTILMWELANEPRCESDPSGDMLQSWIDEMAGYIKSIDNNHLVSTGEEGWYNIPGRPIWDWKYNGKLGVDYIRNHQSTYIDICSFHLYPQGYGMSDQETLTWIEEHIRDAHDVIGKPVYLGEFGITADHGAPDADEQMARRNQLYGGWFNSLDGHDGDGAALWQLLAHQDDGSLFPDYWNWGVYYPEDADTSAIVREFSKAMNGRWIVKLPTSSEVNEGKRLQFDISSTDPQNTSLRFSASGLPSGATFTDNLNGTGTFSWMPAYTQAGSYTVHFEIEDGSFTYLRDVPITVNNVLVFGRIYQSMSGVTSPLEGATVSVMDITRTNTFLSTITDLSGDFSIVGTIPDGNYIIKTTKENYNTYSGMTILRNSQALPFSVTLYAPVMGALQDVSLKENEELKIAVSATDANKDELKFRAAGLPQGAVFIDNGDGSAGLSWNPTYAQAGTYSVRFEVTDSYLKDYKDVGISVENILFKGRVLDQFNRGVEGAAVKIWKISTTRPRSSIKKYTVISQRQTDSGGLFSFNDNLPTAVYLVTCEKSGYKMYSQEMVFDPGLLTQEDIILRKIRKR